MNEDKLIPAAAGADAHLVVTDGYDRDARSRELRGPALDELVAKGSRLLPNFSELVEDLFSLCFKLAIRLRDDHPASLAWNRRVLQAVVDAEDLEELRASCALDAGLSASAAIALARAALGEVKKGELFTDEELLGALGLEGSEERLAMLRRAASELEPSASMRARFEREMRREEARERELAARLDEALEELPRSLAARMKEATRAAVSRVSEERELSEAFAAGVGAEIPDDAAARIELADSLHGNEKLLRLAAIAGAFRQEAMAMRKRRIRRAPSELHRVERGGELSRLLPNELAAFSSKSRRLDFLRRLMERDLAQYELEGADRGGRGPLVICVDGSGSMRGSRELWAKGISLALLEIARRQNRRAVALVFSDGDVPIERFELLSARRRRGGSRRPADLGKVVAFASHFPGGGTDFEQPLRAALEVLREAGLERGDIVFVTDGGAPVSGSFVQELYLQKRKLGFGVYGVLIDDPGGGGDAASSDVEEGARELRKIADKLTSVTRLTSDSVRELFEAL